MYLTRKDKKVLKELNKKKYQKSFADIEFLFGKGQKKYETNIEFQEIVNEFKKLEYLEISGGNYRSEFINKDFSKSKGNYENICAKITIKGQDALKNQSFDWFRMAQLIIAIAILIVGILNFKKDSTSLDDNGKENLVTNINTDTTSSKEKNKNEQKNNIKSNGRPSKKYKDEQLKDVEETKPLALGIYIDKKILLNKYKFDYDGLLTQDGIEHGYLYTDSSTLDGLKVIKPNQKIILHTLIPPNVNQFELYDSLIINKVSKRLQGSGSLVLTNISKIEPDFYLIEPEKKFKKGNYSLFDTSEKYGYLFRIE